MIEELATVAEVKDGKIWLETEIKSTCSSCVQSNSCGTSVIAKAFSGKKNLIGLDFDGHAKIGQQVLLAIEESAVLNASILVYLVPTIILLISALSSQYLFVTVMSLPELASVIASVLIAALSFWILKLYLNAPQNLAKFYPQIVDIKPLPSASDSALNIEVKEL